MKRTIALFLALFAAGGFAGAQTQPQFSISAGGGGILSYTFTRYNLEGTARNGTAINSQQSMDRFNYGGCMFFDATYTEFALLFQWAESRYDETMGMGSNGQSLSNSTGSQTEQMMGISLLGKYPFTINKQITLFPLLGLEYYITMRELRQPDDGTLKDRSQGKLPEDQDKDGNPYPLSAWNSLWIDLGCGMDYSFSGPLYIRGELLFGFRLPTPYEMGALEMLKKQFDIPDSDLKMGGLTGQPALKILVGYRFF